MAEELKQTEETQEKATQAEEKEKQESRNLLDPVEQIRLFGRGRMELQEPIQDGENTVTELKWDFLALRGMEYVEALDMDPMAGGNCFRITSRQALSLFAAAAAKGTKGLDAKDIRQRLGVLDTPNAVQTATIFFNASSRAGRRRIYEA